ncbi:hypothetical protein GQ44DRAFT_832599 [Phaeosphaeriaceae sp. PMI808]|nr:hypothetical protein GQ44DRAFT_832599 [Phaeosphaeriaceae sp. PMI808]
MSNTPTLKEGVLSPTLCSLSVSTAEDNQWDNSAQKGAAWSNPLVSNLKEKVLSSNAVHSVTNLPKSTFKELGKLQGIVNDEPTSKEKLRGFLNYWVTPGIQVRYVDDTPDESYTLDLDLLPDTLPGDQDDVSVPLRMFDLETGNMVHTASLAAEDRYCMLSHSWKGDEVNYAYVKKVRRRGLEGVNSDVDAVVAACDADIKECRKNLEEYHGTTSLVQIPRLYKADVAKAQSEQEANHYRSLLAYFDEENEPLSLKRRKHIVDHEQSFAEEEFGEADSLYDRVKLKGIRGQHKLNYAIEEMLSVLQRKRSARKVKESVQRAREIFRTKNFPMTGRKYIWLDNCCINKKDNGELTESLVCVGEWYANAEFCLVHLDTPFDHNDWLDEWDLWAIKGKRLTDLPKGPTDAKRGALEHYGGIEQWEPKWSTRGWTLQELVLSKVTYYVNPNWKHLSRGVENLGQYYNLCPFIDQYTWNQEHVGGRQLLKELNKALSASEFQEELNRILRLEDGRKVTSFVESIVRILDGFGFVVPNHLDEVTARIRIGRSVRAAVKGLQGRSEHGDACKEKPCALDLFELETGAELKHQMDTPHSDPRVKEAQDQKREAVEEDRQYIASFNKIQCLKTWSKGTARDRFSAHSVLHLASSREVTKTIDIAYSLMGILGVRFPAFPAEGLTKALCRLMDDIVVTSNDVSVFNWSGKHCASPIRGRSLYASNISGFHVDFSRKKELLDVDRELMRRFQEARTKKLETAKAVNYLLLNAVVFVLNEAQSHDTLDSFEKLAKFIRMTDFNILRSNSGLKHIFKVMEEAKKEDKVSEGQRSEADEGTKIADPRPLDGEGNDGESRQVEVDKCPDHLQAVSEGGPSPEGNDNASNESGISSEGNGTNTREQSQEPENNTTNYPKPKSGLFGRQMVPKKLANLTPEVRFQWPKKGGKAVPEQAEGKQEAKKKAAEEQVKKTREAEEKAIAEKSKKQREADEKKAAEEARKQQKAEEKTRALHPAGVKNRQTMETGILPSAGIRGVFDIQRVVVTMLQPERLRSKIRNAISEHEKIDGWCTISTGFTLTMVTFSCERPILAQQLDLVDVIRETVLTDTNDRTSGVQPDDQGDDAGHREGNAQQPPSETLSTGRPKRRRTGANSEDKTDDNELEKQYGNSIEQRKVSRMIDFVTASDLHVIAGEWVLARFSDSPGAKWFLCRLELGSDSQFHARHIPTDEFGFEDAIPEAGLVEYWHTFLRAKKAVVCDVLSSFLDSKKSFEKADVYVDWLDNRFDINSRGGGGKDTRQGGDSNEEHKEGRCLEEKEKQGQPSAVRQIARFLAWSVRGGFSERRAKYLQKQLQDKALANVPVRLQAAILALENNETLLPVMFHSGRDVQFF